MPSPNSNPNRVLLQTDTAALLTYSCDSAAGCQLSTEVRYPSPSPSPSPLTITLSLALALILTLIRWLR